MVTWLPRCHREPLKAHIWIASNSVSWHLRLQALKNSPEAEISKRSKSVAQGLFKNTHVYFSFMIVHPWWVTPIDQNAIRFVLHFSVCKKKRETKIFLEDSNQVTISVCCTAHIPSVCLDIDEMTVCAAEDLLSTNILSMRKRANSRKFPNLAVKSFPAHSRIKNEEASFISCSQSTLLTFINFPPVPPHSGVTGSSNFNRFFRPA